MARLFARLGKEHGYKWQPVQRHPKTNAWVEVKDATGYFVRYTNAKGERKVSRSVENFADAKLRLAQCEVEERGGKPAESTSPTGSGDGERIRIADAVREYKEDLKTVDKAKATVAMYSNAVNGFVESCRKEFLDELSRKDILAYLAWMRENLDTRATGDQNRTIRNRLRFLSTFLSKQGIRLKKAKGADASASGLLFHDDLPKVVKEKPKKYDQETLDLLLKHADADQRDYLNLLLWSGLRDEEVQYLQYSDFNWRKATVTVNAKPVYGWRPKDCEVRTVVLPTEIAQQLHSRMDRPQSYADGYRKPLDADLVFPNGDGRPDSHLIYRLHTVAKKAGINLKGKRAGHMFRKTFGSRIAKKLGLRAAMEALGHSDIETTALYLAADDADSQKSRKSIDELYANGD
jgi:integrase